MGLAIYVGALAQFKTTDAAAYEWHKVQLGIVNTVLAEKHITQHFEPEILPAMDSRDGFGGFPYSFIHYLRRIYAHKQLDPNWTPVEIADGQDPADDPAISHELAVQVSSHLICHSDADGYYVPVEFAKPLIDDRLCGGMLGSSQALMRELIKIAPALGISLTDHGELTDAEAQRIDEAADEEAPWEKELVAWLSLFEAARLSIRHKTAIVFS
jgi:hypothetical protein